MARGRELTLDCLDAIPAAGQQDDRRTMFCEQPRSRSADSLLAIVDDVLDFSKIEAGRLQLDPVDCDLVELVEHTVEMLAARAATKGIELLCDPPPQPLPRFKIDAVRLRQVLVNLGGNAVKFTERGEVTLRVVVLSADARAQRIRFEVADTGVGIAPENQSRIFEEFAQEDSSTTRRFGGTGLGLAISRQLVELMGGQLSLTSTPGAGSTFYFELALPLATSGTAVPPPRSIAGLKVLVIHDNAAARGMIVTALRAWDAQPREATTLKEGATLASAETFQAVVVDDWLIGEAQNLWKEIRFRQSVSLRTVRLLSFVSLSQENTVAQSLFDTELTKPLRLTELHRALVGDLEQSQAQSDRTVILKMPAGLLAPLNGRVLVVEDQPLNREVAVGILSSLGIEAATANDGEQALRLLDSERFDIVLMDCEMPVMDGYSATRSLRAREATGRHLPVIALTADATDAGRAACLEAGMDDYLPKPFRREVLHSMLSRWLSGAPVKPLIAAAPISTGLTAAAPRQPEGPVLDSATLDALRSLPRSGSKDMLTHIGELYLLDSQRLVRSIEEALGAQNAQALAHAAHAWRSYNGNVGAHGLAALCRELEDSARAGDFEQARSLYAQIVALHGRVRDELQIEMRRSA